MWSLHETLNSVARHPYTPGDVISVLCAPAQEINADPF